jgi:adenosylmethionine-8-amino-7-oxononanoate aminotransferase
MTLTERDQTSASLYNTKRPQYLLLSKEGKEFLWDENDKEYIDAIASWWVNPYGHSNTFIADAIYKQLTTLEHVLLEVFS